MRWLCLVAAKVLLDPGCDEERVRLNDDAELLLSFCRLALAPYQAAPGADDEPLNSGTQAYLRPFYDAVFCSKLRVSRDRPTQVKDLIEIQQEATQGRQYVKPAKAHPVLALYVVRGNAYLLYDFPRGPSRCHLLTDDYELNEIREAMLAGDQSLLPMPREVDKAMSQWRDDQYVSVEIRRDQTETECRWEDPVNGMDKHTVLYAPRSELRVGISRPATRFPFGLPNGFIQIFRSPPKDIPELGNQPLQSLKKTPGE